MKHENTNTNFTHNYRKILLAATLAGMVVVAGACSTKPATKNVQHSQTASQPQAVQVSSTSLSPTVKAEAKPAEKTVVKKPASKLLRYNSRNYAVSFEYPWQYSFVNAKTVHEIEALQPKPDGHDGQITLARVELPNGFYPDSDFESGYFTLSLNPDVQAKDCLAAIEKDKQGSAQSAKINDADFFWVEAEQTGKGGASRIRNYVAFTNDVCYEFELGVKTRNENGLAREVNADQVMQRLEGMLKSVKFDGTEPKGTMQSSIEQPKTEGQK
jgi:hypothetical protein